ncbi:MAG: hypothetical protein JST91_06015 [Actinobacteria bacterium]|nr:hypothetical protein [Actinomycetota bacterium]MBS1900313.1 hypothetical protein [Actinomycetota bacterium]
MVSPQTTIAPPSPVPAGAPPTLSPGGRTAARVILVAAAAVVVVGVVAALGVTSWGLSTFRVTADTQNLSATARSVLIDTADVPVAIRITTDDAATAPTVSLRLITSTRPDEHRLAVTDGPDGARVALEGPTPSSLLGWARGGEITVTLPPEQARRMTVRTEQNAGVVLANADLDQLIARTDDGGIFLGGSARRIEVHTVSGAVASRHPLSVRERFAASTADGDISVDFAEPAPPVVEAISRDGDVTIGLPGSGPYLVRAQSAEASRVRVPETTDRDAAVAEITARSENGEVVVDRDGLGRR